MLHKTVLIAGYCNGLHKSVAKRFQKEGWSVSSVTGTVETRMDTAYLVTKFIRKGFTESLAKPLNIQFKSICPGTFVTNFIKTAMIQTECNDRLISESVSKVVAHNILSSDANMLVNACASMSDKEFIIKRRKIIFPKLKY